MSKKERREVSTLENFLDHLDGAFGIPCVSAEHDGSIGMARVALEHMIESMTRSLFAPYLNFYIYMLQLSLEHFNCVRNKSKNN